MTLDTRTQISLFGICALIGMAGLVARPQAANSSGAAVRLPVEAAVRAQTGAGVGAFRRRPDGVARHAVFVVLDPCQ